MADQTTETPSPSTTEERRQARHESRTGSTYKAFMKDLAGVGGFDLELAECAAPAVLCALEQRVYGEVAKGMEAQLPFKLKELLQRCEIHEGRPRHKFGKEEFIQMVAEEIDKSPEEAEPIIRAVLTTVRAQITEGEAEKFGNMLPHDLREYWLQPA